MAISIAKNHEHETILYTEQEGTTIAVPVTSGAFDGYQVIVMPSHEPIIEEKTEIVKFPSNLNEASCKKVD